MTANRKGKWGNCPHCKLRTGRKPHPCPFYHGKMCKCCLFCTRDCRLDKMGPNVTVADPKWPGDVEIKKKRIRHMAQRDKHK